MTWIETLQKAIDYIEAHLLEDIHFEEGDSISNIWESFYKEFLPQSGYEICVETDYEVYFDEQKEDLFCELWIPIQKL